jgi:hypothetical protein
LVSFNVFRGVVGFRHKTSWRSVAIPIAHIFGVGVMGRRYFVSDHARPTSTVEGATLAGLFPLAGRAKTLLVCTLRFGCRRPRSLASIAGAGRRSANLRDLCVSILIPDSGADILSNGAPGAESKKCRGENRYTQLFAHDSPPGFGTLRIRPCERNSVSETTCRRLSCSYLIRAWRPSQPVRSLEILTSMLRESPPLAGLLL